MTAEIVIGFDADVIVLIGSILPKVGSLQLPQDQAGVFQRNDLLATAGLFTALTVIGWGLVSLRIAARLICA
jgi:hypothetical protein